MSMAETQKQRHLGKGMKPRNTEETAVDNVNVEETVSSETVQEAAVPEPVLEPPNPVETPHMVEAEKEVAVTEGFGEAPEAENSLEMLMRLSRAVDIGVLESRPNPSPGMIAIPTAEEIAALTGTSDDLEWPERESRSVLSLGEQPDGTYNMVVTIREGYIAGIQSQAENDHETVEEWVSTRFGEWLESWWAPPRNA